ncbi:MAG: aldehyde dehydrogenase [Bradyrhizobium sp.]|nr:aldehyde dehydrogenase [Bradyrhizobium sp.]
MIDVKMAGAALISRQDRFFIGGEWVAPETDRTFDVIVSSTEELFLRVADAQRPDMDRAIDAARTAFDDGPWPRMSHGERAGYLDEMARLIAARADAVSTIWTSEVGVVRAVSEHIGPAVSGIFAQYAALAKTFSFEERHIPGAGGNHGPLVREPVGVVAAIIPWNAPLPTIAHKIAPALLAGCTVILKASPEAPGAAYIIAEIAEAIRLPAGVLNVVTSDREVSEHLVRHPAVDKVTFTGSSAAGRRIASICGERVARCTLELGGKSAAIILDDYDLEEAAASLAGSASLMTGQVCSSLTRVIVTRARHDQLVEAMAARFAAISVGDPFDLATQMGPLATGLQRERVEGYIARGRAEGAVLAVGGGRPAYLPRGYFVEPTLFANVENGMAIAREEIFGPVVSVIAAADERKAVEIANDSEFGLNGSVFTNDADRAYDVARRLRTGTVGHNSFRTDFSIAFGGFKQSGIGREGGAEGLLAFLESKTVILDELPRHLRC